MKLGRVEGTPEEVRDFFVNNGLQISDYLERPEEPLAKIWLVVPAISLVVGLLSLVLFAPTSRTPLLLLFLFSALSLVGLCLCIQLRFKNTVGTTVVAVGGLVAILVAAGILAPKETIDAIKELKK